MSKVSNKYVKSLTPIKDSILWNKTFPRIKDFPQKYKKEDIIPDNIDIKKIASEYFKSLVTIEDKCHEILSLEGKSYQTLSKQFLHYKKDSKFADIDKTLSVVMGKHFDNLKPKVRLHTNVFCHLFTVKQHCVMWNITIRNYSFFHNFKSKMFIYRNIWIIISF